MAGAGLTTPGKSKDELFIHHGGCHCQAVRFEILAPEAITASECNCSICTQAGYLHLIIPARDFKLLQGEDQLQTYQFGTHTARHLFCKTCGIKSFYVPRSHPDGISVNVHCLEKNNIKTIKIETFDGKNWEQNIDTLKT